MRCCCGSLEDVNAAASGGAQGTRAPLHLGPASALGTGAPYRAPPTRSTFSRWSQGEALFHWTGMIRGGQRMPACGPNLAIPSCLCWWCLSVPTERASLRAGHVRDA